MTEPLWPEWGASLPPRPAYDKRYLTGPQGDMHAGEVLDVVTGSDVEYPGTMREYHILRCHPCISIHAWPLPDPAALKQFYAEQFYQMAQPQMVQDYTADALWWTQCVYEPIFARCARLLTVESDHTRPRFVDIGAGVGLALATAQQSQGWDTWGVEVNAERCQALTTQGHTMLHGTLEDHLEPLRWYRPHMALLYETLEHAPAPESMLLQCHDMLASGGLLVVVVPQDYNALQMRVCAEQGLLHYWLAPPQHLSYFTPVMLKLLLRRCGFTLLYARSTYPMEQFLLDGRQYVGHPEVGRACHRERMAGELAAVRAGRWQEMEALYQHNLAYQIGREMLFIARKH